MQLKNFVLTVLVLFVSISAFSQAPINMTPGNNNQVFTTCNGFLIDSGGQGRPGYSNNENIVITICPDTPGQLTSILFSLFDLDATNTGTLQNPDLDFMSIYDGPSTSSNTLGTYTGTQLQNVLIQATQLNPSGCITLEFYSNNVGTGQFAASVNCQTPCANPQAGGIIMNGITPDSIRVCVGDSINFQEQGSFAQQGFSLVNYMWDFMDGDTANGTSVFHAYDVPGYYAVQLFVTDDNGCSNSNFINLQVLVGTIPDFTGFPADTSICLGDSVSFVAVPGSYQVGWNGFQGIQQINDGCLPDIQLGVPQEVELYQTGFSNGSTIQSVNDIQSICLDLEHSFMGDLIIQVECPNGQSAILHQQGGGGTQIGIPNPLDNVDCSDPTTQGTPFTYCFTPQATETWVDWVNAQAGFGLTIPAGNYVSVQPLSNLVGCPLNGVWTLGVTDNWAADDGTLFGFGLTLDSSFYPPQYAFEPQIGLADDSSYWFNPQFQTYLSADADSLVVTPTQSGAFTYEYVVIDNFGCTYDTSVVLNVGPFPTFAGNDTSICDYTSLTLNGQVSGMTDPCNYILTMEDAFADGWSGNSLTIIMSGDTTNYTYTNPSLQIENLPTVSPGDTMFVTFNANGLFPGECSWNIADGNGNILVSMGTGQTIPVTDTIVVNCVPTYTYEWTPPNLVSDSTIANPQFTGTGTGSQQLIFTADTVGNSSCGTTDTVNITIIQTPYAGADNTITIDPNIPAFDLFPLLGTGVSTMGVWLNNQGDTVTMPYDPQVLPSGIYIYQTDSLGCTEGAIVTVNFISTVGIEGDLEAHTIKVFPNPASDQLFIHGAANSQIELRSMTGQVVKSMVCTSDSVQFDVSNLSGGVYYLVFQSAGDQLTQKVVIR